MWDLLIKNNKSEMIQQLMMYISKLQYGYAMANGESTT